MIFIPQFVINVLYVMAYPSFLLSLLILCQISNKFKYFYMFT